jgi:hypothetical protein
VLVFFFSFTLFDLLEILLLEALFVNKPVAKPIIEKNIFAIIIAKHLLQIPQILSFN